MLGGAIAPQIEMIRYPLDFQSIPARSNLLIGTTGSTSREINPSLLAQRLRLTYFVLVEREEKMSSLPDRPMKTCVLSYAS